MSFDVGAVVGHLVLDTKKWDASFSKAAKDQKTFSGYIKDNSAKIKTMGRNMTIAGGAIVGALGLAVKSAVNFNQEMANVATLIPDSTERVIALKESVQDLATETGKSTTDISGGLYQVISAFGDTADTAKILEVNVIAAAAGMAMTTDSINLTSAVMKGYGDVSLAATKKVADLAFQTVKLGQTTFPELAQSMGRAIPVAAKLGVSQEELFTGFATLTGVTGDATVVTTQLFAAMNAIMKPTTDMKVAIKKLGYSSAETMVKELGLVGSMRALVKTTDGSVEAVSKLVPNIRALPAVFALTGGQAEIFDEKLKKMKESAGAMPEAFREMSEGINASGFNMARLKEMMVVLTQRIGDSLAPAIGNLAVSVGKIVNEISDWIKEHPKLTQIIAKAALGIGALMAALGPLLMMLPGLVTAFALVKGKITKLIPSLATLKGSIGGVSGLLKNMPAIAGAAFVGWKVGEAIGKVELLGKSINEHLVDGIGNAIENLGLFQSKVELTGETAEKLAGRVKKAAQMKQKFADMAKKATDAVVDLKDKGLKPLEAGTKSLTEAIDEAKEKTQTWIDYLADIGIKTVEEKSDRVEELEGYIDDLSQAYKDGIIDLDDYTEAVKAAKGEIKDLSTSISTTALPAFRDMSDIAGQAVDDIADRVPDITDAVETESGNVTSLWDTMTDGLQTKWASTIGEVLRGATSLKDGLKGVWDSVITQFSDMIGTMVSKFVTDFVGGLISGAGTAGKAVSTLAGGAASLGTAITSLATGVASILPAIATAIASAAKILFGALPEIAAIAAVALAIYAGFMAVNALFGAIKSGGGMMDATNRELHNIWEEARNILNISKNLKNITTNIMNSAWKIEKILVKIKDKIGGTSTQVTTTSSATTPSKVDELRNRILRDIREYTRGTLKVIKNLTTAASGAVITSPQLVMAHGTPANPELFLPSDLAPALANANNKKAANNYHVSVNNTINLNGTIITDREFTRKRMMPEMVSALESNLGKTKIKQILGI